VKWWRAGFPAIAVLSCVTVGKGDTLAPSDPSLIIRSGGASGGCCSVGLGSGGSGGGPVTFSFTSPSGDSGDFATDESACQVNGQPLAPHAPCDFENDSGKDFFNLTLTISPGGGLVSCIPDFGFSDCVVFQPGGPTSPTMLFFSGNSNPPPCRCTGISDGHNFGFILEDWAPNTQVEGVFNTPEPGTWVLFLSSLGASGVLSRRRRRAQSTVPPE
jgi:hypothetical protein